MAGPQAVALCAPQHFNAVFGALNVLRDNAFYIAALI